MTEAWPLDEFASARVDLLRGQVALASGMVSDAPPLLLSCAPLMTCCRLSAWKHSPERARRELLATGETARKRPRPAVLPAGRGAALPVPTELIQRPGLRHGQPPPRLGLAPCLGNDPVPYPLV
jgi:hypothetical protein